MTRDDLRPAAIEAMAEALNRTWQVNGKTGDGYPAAILDALTPEGRTIVARYLLGDAIEGLDAAWAAVVAVLPEGWGLALSARDGMNDAYATNPVMSSAFEASGLGPTPAAALRALAAKLAEPKP